jgi:hypothetical protein
MTDFDDNQLPEFPFFPTHMFDQIHSDLQLRIFQANSNYNNFFRSKNVFFNIDKKYERRSRSMKFFDHDLQVNTSKQ